ncbi:MAG: KamA family radical SAM protein, partial [Mesorhizobium sp.]
MTSHLDTPETGMVADPDAAWQGDVRAGVRQVRDLDSLPLSPAERAA